jgi:hypothetical protein
MDGLNIGLGSAIFPGKNEVEGMTLLNTTNADIMIIDSADSVLIRRVRFEGSQTNFVVASQLKACILSRATVQATSGITVEDSDFSRQSIAVSVTEQANNVVIFACNFEYLYRGIVIGQTTVTPYNINNIRVCFSHFDEVGSSAIMGFNNVVNLISSGNVFKNVANNLTNTATAPVISYTGDNCYSVADVFSRSESAAFPTVELNGTAGFATLPGGKMLASKSLTTGSRSVSLVDGQTGLVLAGILGVVGRNVEFNYVIERSGLSGDPIVRNGVITVAAAGSTIVYSDDYVETNDAGVTLIPSVNAGLVELKYQSDTNISFPTITLKAENKTLL